MKGAWPLSSSIWDQKQKPASTVQLLALFSSESMLHLPTYLNNFISYSLPSNIHDIGEDRLRRHPTLCHSGDGFLHAMTDRCLVMWQEVTEDLLWDLTCVSTALLRESPREILTKQAARDTHLVHSFDRSKKSWKKGMRKQVMNRLNLPTGHGVSIPELWRNLKSWSISVCVWVIGAGRLHRYLQPCPFAHPAAISMSQESVNSQKKYKNMIFFSFYRPPAACQCGAQPFV